MQADEVGKVAELVTRRREGLAEQLGRALGGAAGCRPAARARWTSDPRVAWMDGASGSFSMLANRKASGHEVNDSTRLGDRLVGTSNMTPNLRRGCHRLA